MNDPSTSPGSRTTSTGDAMPPGPSRSGRAVPGRKSRLLPDDPILVVVGFNLLTLAILFTAPVRWDTPNLPDVYRLVLLCQFLILIGFQLGRRLGFSTRSKRGLPLASGATAMKFLVVFYALTFVIGYAYRMGFSPLDVRGMVNLLLAGLQDRHFGYETALRGTGLGPIPWRVYFLVSIVNQCFFIAGFIRWKQMSRMTKLVFSGFVFLDLFFSLGRGTSFGLVAMVTTFLLSSMTRWKSRFATVMLIACLFVGSVVLFSYNLYSRSGNVERAIELSEFGQSTLILDDPLLNFVPPPLRATYLNVLAYFGGGYYHASLALDLEFRSTWFLGSNPALITLGQAIGVDVWNDTYMHRLQAAKGIDELGVWHSAYAWFANDVSFYGVPFTLFGIAYLFGFSWAASVRGDFLSKIVFVMLGNMLLFLFANNTYLSSVLYAFMFLVPFWMITRFTGRVPVRVRADTRRTRGWTSGAAELHSQAPVRR